MIAGPNWKGEAPKGEKSLSLGDGIRLRGLSHAVVQAGRHRQREESPGRLQGADAIGVLGQPAPKAAPPIDFIKPLSPAEEKISPEFFNILNFVLQFCPTDPTETELMARFAKIGVGAGKTFDGANSRRK